MASIRPSKAHESSADNPAIGAIKDAQRDMVGALGDIARIPAHEPEILLLGCVDARIRPIDLGIPEGKALIERKIAALIPPPGGKDSESMEALLEFAIKGKRVKDIVVMGHTDCGGVKGCLCGTCGFHSDGTAYEMNALDKYLEQLHPARERVREKFLTPDERKVLDDPIHPGRDKLNAKLQPELERETVRESYANLIKYDVVKQAVEAGTLKIHGWMVHTDSLYLDELKPDQSFQPLVDARHASKILLRRSEVDVNAASALG